MFKFKLYTLYSAYILGIRTLHRIHIAQLLFNEVSKWRNNPNIVY